jgi:hypothetical protein
LIRFNEAFTCSYPLNCQTCLDFLFVKFNRLEDLNGVGSSLNRFEDDEAMSSEICVVAVEGNINRQNGVGCNGASNPGLDIPKLATLRKA